MATVRTRDRPEAIRVDSIQERKKISSVMEASSRQSISGVAFAKPPKSGSIFEPGRGSRPARSRVDSASSNSCGKSESLGLIQPSLLRASDEAPKDRGRRIESNPSPPRSDVSGIERSVASSMSTRPRMMKTIIIRTVVR